MSKYGHSFTKDQKYLNFISSSQSGLPTENSGSLVQFLVVYGLPLIHTLQYKEYFIL